MLAGSTMQPDVVVGALCQQSAKCLTVLSVMCKDGCIHTWCPVTSAWKKDLAGDEKVVQNVLLPSSLQHASHENCRADSF
jgi:hypothetical protein